MFTRDANLTLHSLAVVILDFDDAKVVASVKDLMEIWYVTLFLVTCLIDVPDSVVYGTASSRTVEEHRILRVAIGVAQRNRGLAPHRPVHPHVLDDYVPSLSERRHGSQTNLCRTNSKCHAFLAKLYGQPVTMLEWRIHLSIAMDPNLKVKYTSLEWDVLKKI